MLPDEPLSDREIYTRLLGMWRNPQRSYADAQAVLIALRERIAREEGIEPQEVQDSACREAFKRWGNF